MRRTIIVACTLILIGIAPAAHASDGCFEISHVNVGSVGALTTRGCYVLTSNITQGLTIGPVNGLSLDLNGFSITPASGSAVTLTAPLENFEIRNGSVIGGDPTVPAIDTIGFGEGLNHIYRDLRIQSDAIGIRYQLDGGELDNLQFEDVMIASEEQGIQLIGNTLRNLVRNIRFNRIEVRSNVMEAIYIFGASTAGALQVYGFQLESSSVTTNLGPVTIFVANSGMSGAPAADGEFEGSIRNCDLAGPDSGISIVLFDVLQGSLHCTNNNLTALTTAGGTMSAFAAPAGGSIVIRDNTSFVPLGAPPATGLFVSPIVAHDGTTPILSNLDVRNAVVY